MTSVAMGCQVALLIHIPLTKPNSKPQVQTQFIASYSCFTLFLSLWLSAGMDPRDDVERLSPQNFHKKSNFIVVLYNSLPQDWNKYCIFYIYYNFSFCMYIHFSKDKIPHPFLMVRACIVATSSMIMIGWVWVRGRFRVWRKGKRG